MLLLYKWFLSRISKSKFCGINFRENDENRAKRKSFFLKITRRSRQPIKYIYHHIVSTVPWGLVSRLPHKDATASSDKQTNYSLTVRKTLINVSLKHIWYLMLSAVLMQRILICLQSLSFHLIYILWLPIESITYFWSQITLCVSWSFIWLSSQHGNSFLMQRYRKKRFGK